MAKLSYSDILALSQNFDRAAVTLSPDSYALLLALASGAAAEVFLWSQLTDEEKDGAGALLAKALGELMVSEHYMRLYARFEHRENVGVNAGATFANSWSPRKINWAWDYGAAPEIAFSNDSFTVGVGGDYFFSCRATFVASTTAGNQFRMRLFDRLAANPVIVGNNLNGHAAGQSTIYPLDGIVTLEAGKSYEIQYLSTLARATNGLGASQSQPPFEVYLTAWLFKL